MPRDPRLAIALQLNEHKFLFRYLLQRIQQGELDGNVDPDRYLFRTANTINFFANLTAYMLVTGGQLPPRSVIGTSGRVGLLFDAVAGWLHGCLFGGELSLPPVNDSKGITFVTVVLDTAEANLRAIGCHDLAKQAADLRLKVELSLRQLDPHWVLSSTYLRHIGHVVYAATLVELHRRGVFSGPPPRILLGPSPNDTLLQIMRPYILLEDPPGARYVEMISARKRHLRADGRVATMSESVSAAATAWATERPFAALPDDVRKRGEEVLADLGVPPGGAFVTLHVRQPGYNEHIAWDMGLRDARIADYGPAIAWLVSRGIHVVRLGDDSMERAAPQDGLVDYPFTSAKSDAMDVYLAARCRFHVGTASGMSFVPLLFGRPVLMTNWITPAHMICSPSVVTLPKVLRDRNGAVVPMAVWCDRYREMLERSDAEIEGLTLQDNAPEDLVDAVALMDGHIKPDTGRLAIPPGRLTVSQAVFAASPLRIRPQIPPSFWRRYYA